VPSARADRLKPVVGGRTGRRRFHAGIAVARRWRNHEGMTLKQPSRRVIAVAMPQPRASPERPAPDRPPAHQAPADPARPEPVNSS
jgi:hypothetical protein